MIIPVAVAAEALLFMMSSGSVIDVHWYNAMWFVGACGILETWQLEHVCRWILQVAQLSIRSIMVPQPRLDEP